MESHVKKVYDKIFEDATKRYSTMHDVSMFIKQTIDREFVLKPRRRIRDHYRKGMKVGRLKILGLHEDSVRKKYNYYSCECDCGKTIVKRSDRLPSNMGCRSCASREGAKRRRRDKR